MSKAAKDAARLLSYSASASLDCAMASPQTARVAPVIIFVGSGYVFNSSLYPERGSKIADAEGLLLGSAAAMLIELPACGSITWFTESITVEWR